jgi:Leucine-rich repeat (LRR) protein
LQKGITDLDSLNLCSNLEFLNLSSNEIKDLLPLRYLIKIQFLNLSCNQIKLLDGLELLENLKTLNLAGNSISKIEEFFKLKNLKNLTQLKLSEVKSDFLTTGMPSIEYTNPICKNKNYTKEIFNIFTNLEVVDGK